MTASPHSASRRGSGKLMPITDATSSAPRLDQGQRVDACPEQRPQAEWNAAPGGRLFDPDPIANLLESTPFAQRPHDLANEEGVPGGPLIQPASRFSVERSARNGRP